MNTTAQLPGVWQAVSATVNGDTLPGAIVDQIRLTLTDTCFTTRRGEQTLFDSTYVVDATKSPMEIEMVGTHDFAGKPALGIYALDGDSLQLCYKMPGFGRPNEFASTADSGAFLISLKRAQ